MSLYEYERNGDAQALVGALSRSDNPTIRRRAAEILGGFGDADDRDDVVRALVRAVETEESAVAAAAVDALDELGGDALERLLARLAGGTIGAHRSREARAGLFVQSLAADMPELRMAAASALGDNGHRGAVPHLVRRFGDDEPRVRARAARACGEIGDERAVPPLAGLLSDPTAAVRAEAARALGRIETPRALGALRRLISDDSETVRRIAVARIGELESDAPVEDLLAALRDDVASVRRAAVYSLIQALSNRSPDERRESRRTVASRLSATDDEAVIGPLIRLLRESTRPAQRRSAAWLLGRVTPTANTGRTRTVVDVLVAALCDGEQATRQCAARSLVRVGGTYADGELRSLALDARADTDDRARAVAVLGEIGSERTRAALERLRGEIGDEPGAGRSGDGGGGGGSGDGDGGGRLRQQIDRAVANFGGTGP